MENTTEKSEKTVLCGINLPVSMANELDRIARREGFLKGRSVIARKAIREYIERQCGDQKVIQEAA